MHVRYACSGLNPECSRMNKSDCGIKWMSQHVLYYLTILEMDGMECAGYGEKSRSGTRKQQCVSKEAPRFFTNKDTE